MAELQVALVSPEQELWSGTAKMVLAKTLEGELGILAGHQPVLGVLEAGGVVRIRGSEGGEDFAAAVDGGFLSVSDDQVSILAERAELGQDIDVAEARTALERASSSGEEGSEDEAKHQRARLRAAGHEA